MPKIIVVPGKDLHRASEKLVAIVRADHVDLNDLGKALAAVVAGVAAAFEAADVPSLRMKAAAKALDLKTRKSDLERFVGGEDRLGP